jgi:hypothetical protein
MAVAGVVCPGALVPVEIAGETVGPPEQPAFKKIKMMKERKPDLRKKRTMKRRRTPL